MCVCVCEWNFKKMMFFSSNQFLTNPVKSGAGMILKSKLILVNNFFFLSDSLGNTEHLFSGVVTLSCSLSDGGKWQRFDKNIPFMGCSLARKIE